MLENGLLGNNNPRHEHDDDNEDEHKLSIVYDLDALDHAFVAVQKQFPSHFRHCFAVKSCPLLCVLNRAVSHGLGLECASRIEVILALKSGCCATNIVFDSPCKTRGDLKFALKHGISINADSLDEIEVIHEIIMKHHLHED